MIRAIATLLVSGTLAVAADSARNANTVILDDTGVKNLRLETALAEESDFEETLFALGRIEAISGQTAAVSSRIPGRLSKLEVQPGVSVQAGQEVASVESRQPGNPPPVISLKAPIAGLVTRVETRLGDPVDPDKALLEITNLDEVYAVARVPEHFAGKLKPGATTAHIRAAALPDARFEGKLLRFGTSADGESGTIDAIFALKNPEGLLRSGMRAEFSIVVARRAGVMSVPRSAIQGDPANRFVYVKDFDLKNAFIKTPVVVGEMNDRSAEILNGLMPADDVVTRGAYSLAFAGGGSISLKEALDAAHGHEHNEDGSEITPEQAKANAKAGSPEAHTAQSPFWKITSGVLFALLILSLLRGKKARA